ncbi:MAG: hypothetical protein KatS3mg102_2948 [Planctomycetota bacterium]|nr:MAG: hypothetical protein KatS3mg102_2948 [Planctomycetota bacterium]
MAQRRSWIRRLGRAFLVAGLVLSGAVVLAHRWLIDRVGGAFAGDPAAIEGALSEPARALLRAAWEGIDRERLVDLHVHAVGLGTGGSGAWVNPEMRSWAHPIQHVQFLVYLSAAGIRDLERADEQYVERLLALIRHQPAPGRYVLLAFDKVFRADGTEDLERTRLYVPNEYVFALAARYPEVLIPAMSVHPFRPGALAELERWAARGGRIVKWLPNAMGIDPADPRLDPFYDTMHELDLTLLTHAGEEKAVESEQGQALGNPLLLRRPLERGVRVVVAHCASLGRYPDLDSPRRELRPAFELFLRLMDEERWRGRLFGEISAVTQYNRAPQVLATLLERTDLHPRLLNGSDYPLPAINFLVRTRQLQRLGFITAEEREQLNEIYRYNPLLFDFVLKRTVRHPRTGRRFAPEVFLAKPELGL